MDIITQHDVFYAEGAKQLHYLAAGPANGSLVIFVHGFPATAITWKSHLLAFAALGFLAIAPDMPGYGGSTARHVIEDYCQESIVEGLMALLGDVGRDAAVWIGHDWGAGVTSSVATQYPEAVTGLVNMCVPFHTVELGWDGVLPLVNRTIYPEDEYEYGQWDYMKYYEESFDTIVGWFEKDPAGLCKAMTVTPTSRPTSRFSQFATVRRDGGWFGGIAKPPGVNETGPSLLDDETFDAWAAEMETNDFWGPSAYYMNHERNAEYNGNAASGGYLTQPVLFIHAQWDLTLDTKTSLLPEPMREVCSDLTEVTIDSAHWPQLEKPDDVDTAIFDFIAEKLPEQWPPNRETAAT